MKEEPSKIGDLVVRWIPQVPMPAFEVPVKTLEEAVLLLNTLARYDLFQLKHNIKPDYCNTGGLKIWVEDAGEGEPGWNDWHPGEYGDTFYYDDDSHPAEIEQYLARNPCGPPWLAEAAEALGQVTPNGKALSLTWNQVLDGIRELKRAIANEAKPAFTSEKE